MRIGDYLVQKGLLKETDVDEVLMHSRKTGLRFDEAAVDLGLISRKQLERHFGPNFAMDFVSINPETFPREMADLLPLELSLMYGALPLGFENKTTLLKTQKVLKIGLINPSRQNITEEITNAIRNQNSAPAFAATRIMLIMPDEYCEVMRGVFKVKKEQMLKKADGKIDPTLKQYLTES